MSIKNVKIKNFTVFNDIEIEFGNGVNVIIGENGTGKTHLMKLMYANKSFGRQFDSMKNDYKCFSSRNNFANSSDITITGGRQGGVFIPTKDMLTHSKGLLEMAKKYRKDMPFDKTSLDIIEKAKQWKADIVPPVGKNVLSKLENIIGGKVVVENDTFFIEKTNGRKIEFSMEAEGIKKIALLWQLIMNENIAEDSILFWDEPEANTNPSLYKDIAEILLELSRNSVQIFLTTHNYNFAKYMEVLAKDSDNVRYHSLYKTNDGIKCETETRFSLLSSNALREDNINLYDAEMKKDLEE